MASEYSRELSELRRQVDEEDIVGVYFPRLRCTLLLDLRTTGEDPPMVIVVPPVASAEERLRSLARLRPRLPRPEHMGLVPWTGSVASLEQLGIIRRMAERLESLGGAAICARLADAFDELVASERRQLRDAVTGDGYRTLWQRTRQSD